LSTSASKQVEVSVVVPTLNEGDRLRRTVEGLLNTLPPDGEIVVVDDGSTDGSADFLDAPGSSASRRSHPTVRRFRTERRGSSRARNFGAAKARGRFVVFSDAHVDVSTGWWSPLREAFEAPRIGAVAPVITVIGAPASKGFGLSWASPALDVAWLEQRGWSPYAVPLLPGAFMALRRETFDAVGGFDDGLRLWGSEDAELSLRLWLHGYQQRVVPQLEVAHLFRKHHPYPLGWNPVLHNMLRVALLHFSEARVARVIDALKGNAGFSQAMAAAVSNGLAKRRATLDRSRVYDDDWFFDSFGITL
jgi:glycosyltransferase involved in cell wall biosynthesis